MYNILNQINNKIMIICYTAAASMLLVYYNVIRVRCGFFWKIFKPPQRVTAVSNFFC